MGFRDELNEIDGIVVGVPMMESEETNVLEEVDIEEEWEDDWVGATGAWWLGSLIGELKDEFGEDAAVEAVKWLVDEAYKFSHALQPADVEVGKDVGTQDEPPSGQLGRGYRGRASGLTTTQAEALRRVVAMLADRPPKAVADAKIEDSVMIWKEAAGKLINKGKGVIFSVDKKTGIPIVEPDFHSVYTQWKDMVAKVVGMRPTRQMEQKMEKSITEARKDAAKTLSKMRHGGTVTSKHAKQASTLMRGAKKRTKG